MAPNSSIPKTNASSGTLEFKIPTTALSISVSAKAKRNTGIPVPSNAEIPIHFHSNFFMVFKVFHPKRSKTNAENKIRRAPSCRGSKPTNPFLIRINELPQMMDSTTRYIHLSELFGIA